MIVFQTIGIVLVCTLLLMIALGGLFHALYNDIGGNGSWPSALMGVAVFVGGVALIVKTLPLLPFAVVVTP
jgi:hypothetical protein